MKKNLLFLSIFSLMLIVSACSSDSASNNSGVVAATQPTAVLSTDGGSSYVIKGGALFASGDNTNGQLGTGNNDNSTELKPVNITTPDGVTKQIVLQNNDDIVIGDDAVFVSVDGLLYAWGNNEHGYLGVGSSDAYVNTPQPVIDSDGTQIRVDEDDLADVMLVTYLLASVFLVDDNNTFYAWGDNVDSQLGIGDVDNATVATKVDVELPRNVDEITDVFTSGLLVGADGYLYSWGHNILSLGLGADVSLPVHTPTKIETFKLKDGNINDNILTAFLGSTFALADNGTVFAWGENTAGSLGLGHEEKVYTPTAVTGLGTISVDLSDALYGYTAKEYLNLLLTNTRPATSLYAIKDGKLYAWGLNTSGQLGIGNNDSQSTPQVVNIGGDSNYTLNGDIKDVLYVISDSAFLKFGNQLYSFGNNSLGQLGVGDDNDRNIPTQINVFTLPDEDISDVMIHKSGLNFAINDSGKLYIWPVNNQSPMLLDNITIEDEISDKIYSIVDSYFVMNDEDGQLYAFGANNDYQLGLGHNNGVFPPEPITIAGVNFANAEIDDFEISPHGSFFLNIESEFEDANGNEVEEERLYAWGFNDIGQLGIDTALNDYDRNNNGDNDTIKVPTLVSITTEVDND